MRFKGLTAYAPKNFMLFSEGERGERLYIIQKGKVNITKILDNKEVLIQNMDISEIKKMRRYMNVDIEKNKLS